MSILLTPTDVATLDDIPDGIIFQRTTEVNVQLLESISAVGFSGRYDDLISAPDLSAVATSGLYGDLGDLPTLSTVATSGLYNDIVDLPTLSTVATSGAYSDLSGLPTIPAAQVQSDWTASSGLGVILNKPTLATVATSGSYTDLTSKPTLGISYEGTTERTNSFPIYKSATVSSGTAVFNLTSDGTSGGTALFPNGVITDSVQLTVYDATASYQMNPVFSNSNKTITVTTNKFTTVNILTGVLGQTAANGTVVKLTVYGY